jgi:hypothetical protein
MVMTGGVAVGSAALLGGAVAVGRELGVDVGRMRITRGVGVAVTSTADTCNACGVISNGMERIAPRACAPCDIALSARGATTARPVRTTAAMIPVTTPCRRVADVTALGTVLQLFLATRTRIDGPSVRVLVAAQLSLRER